MNYPKTKTVSQVDDYFGRSVCDPYRWLEDDESEETKAWVLEQNQYTTAYLDQIAYRSEIKDRLQTLCNYERCSAPFKYGEYTYYYKNNGLQPQSVLYREDSKGRVEVFLDPNQFSEDGTTSLSELEFDESGRYVAYSVSEGGSDWTRIHIMDTKTLQPVDRPIEEVKFSSIAWKKDEGFYYSTYESPIEGSFLSGKTSNHQICFHRIGTDPKEDQLIMGGQAFPRRYLSAQVFDQGRFLVVSAADTTSGNELYIADLEAEELRFISVQEGFEFDLRVVDIDQGRVYVLTNQGAPNYRLVAFDMNDPHQWEEVIAQGQDVLEVYAAGGFFFVKRIKDVLDHVDQFDRQGRKVRSIDLPIEGTVIGFKGKPWDTQVYFGMSNYIHPYTLYRYDIAQGEVSLYYRPTIDFNPENYVTQQVFYTSFDGVKIPMTITHKKGLVLNGKNPTILYGYGGFNYALQPEFSMGYAAWLSLGGVLAVPNIRGGGEYGQAWHLAGTQLNKKNVFRDFIQAAHYLQEKGYASSDYLALMGGSNGGLLVGAVMTMEPQLARVAIPQVGVLDMLRYHQFTAGAGWTYDYGTPQDSVEMFEYLYSYSPLHAIRAHEQYPSTLVCTGDHDDRVVPAHSFKFIATLQEKQAGVSPCLLRVELNAGHGAGQSVQQIIQQYADEFGFILFEMGIQSLSMLE